MASKGTAGRSLARRARRAKEKAEEQERDYSDSESLDRKSWQLYQQKTYNSETATTITAQDYLPTINMFRVQMKKNKNKELVTTLVNC